MKRKKISLSYMKKPSNSEDCSESRIKISVPASFPAIGQFLQCLPLIGCRKMHISLAAFRTIFSITGGFRNNCF